MRFQAPWRSPGNLLQTEMDARFLHMASPLSLLFWLITPTHLSTHKTLQLTSCLTDGRCVDSIRVGQQGDSWRKVTEQQGRTVGVLFLCTLTEFILVGKNEWQPFTKLSYLIWDWWDLLSLLFYRFYLLARDHYSDRIICICRSCKQLFASQLVLFFWDFLFKQMDARSL